MDPVRPPRATPRGLRLKLVLACYVLAAALLPLAHHHIANHLKSSTHCPACAVGSAGELGPEPAPFGVFTLKDAGDVARQAVRPVQSARITFCPGRAPPAIG